MLQHTRHRCARIALVAAAALSLLVPTGLVLAADHPAAEHPGGPQVSAEEMQRMMALIQPGPLHEQMAKLAGSWKASTKMWEGPGEPLVGGGTITFEMVLGGRYLLGRHIGTYRDMPFEGMSIDGYDNGKKEYFSLWFDNFGTGVMRLTGQPAAEGRGINLAGTMFDPMRMQELKVREEVRYEGEKKFVMTMYMDNPDGSGEMKVMEYTAEKQ